MHPPRCTGAGLARATLCPARRIRLLEPLTWRQPVREVLPAALVGEEAAPFCKGETRAEAAALGCRRPAPGLPGPATFTSRAAPSPQEAAPLRLRVADRSPSGLSLSCLPRRPIPLLTLPPHYQFPGARGTLWVPAGRAKRGDSRAPFRYSIACGVQFLLSRSLCTSGRKETQLIKLERR